MSVRPGNTDRSSAGSGTARAGLRRLAPENRLGRSILVAACALTVAIAACDARPRPGDPPPPTEDRLEDWAGQPAGIAVPVSLGFGRPLPDSVIAALLERSSLRPYAVYLTAAGTRSAHRREPSRASLELLGEAREQTVAQLRTALCAEPGRARGMLGAATSGPDSIAAYREVLSRFLSMKDALPSVELGAPVVYGVEAVGELDAVRAVGSDPVVASFEPGWRGRTDGADTTLVSEPPPPDTTAPALDSAVAGLAPDEVVARMRQLAEDGMGLCPDAGRTGPEPR